MNFKPTRKVSRKTESLNCNNKRLAESYINIQTYDKIYSPEEALKKGTLFPELYRPYS